MARYRKQQPLQDLPGLFDEIEIDMTRNDYPIHPEIAKHAERVRLSGGNSPAKRLTPETSLSEPLKTLKQPDILNFISFGSGSSGNCAYIGNRQGGFIIDAGVDFTKVVGELEANGIKMNSVAGICLTHDHGDHIRYAYSFVRKYRHLKIFCTPKTFNGIMRRHNISRRLKDYHSPIYKEIPFNIGDIKITAYEVCHDGTDNVGFFIEYGQHSFAISTDLGHISERADHYMRQADYLVIESNYDKTMLINGEYAEYLKARILADNGHLDNEVTAQYVSKIYSPKLKYVFLCHLSHDNNTPSIALDTVSRPLKNKGIIIGDGTGSISSREADIQLVALPRFESSLFYSFRKD